MTSDQIVAFTIDRFETGLYTDDPDDAGGATRWGITQRTLQAYRRQVTGNDHLIVSKDDVRHLDRGEAIDCAVQMFLTEPKLVLIADWRLRCVVFDFGFHAGPPRAVMTLQALLPPLAVDGDFGPKSQAAVNRVAEATMCAFRYLTARSRYHLTRMKEREASRKYARGWWDRVTTLQELIAPTVTPLAPTVDVGGHLIDGP